MPEAKRSVIRTSASSERPIVTPPKRSMRSPGVRPPPWTATSVGVGRGDAAAGDRVHPGPLLAAGDRAAAAQVLERAAGDHEQEQVEDAEEGELERYRRGISVHRSGSLLDVEDERDVPRETSSPGARREVSMRRPLTLTPLVEPRSTICQSPELLRRSSACRRETF